MNTYQVASLVLLFLALAFAIWRRVNIGLLGFGAAFVMVLISAVTVKQAYLYFPASIFTLLVGVSLLFTHLEKSGGLTWFVNKVYGLIGERTVLIPWAGFALGAAVSSVGALSTAPITLLVPIVAALSRRHPPLFFISEMAVIVGANVAALSPFNPCGSVILEAARIANVQYAPWTVWAIGMVIAFAVVLVFQVVFSAAHLYEADAESGIRAAGTRGFLLIRASAGGDEAGATLQPAYALCSGLAIAVFVGLVIFAGADVGLTSLSLALLLLMIFPGKSSYFFRKVPWNAVIVLCGLLVFIGTMQKVGTMDAIQSALLALTSSQVLLIFVIAYLTAILCNIESSTIGVIGLVMPMLFAIMGHSQDLTLIIAAVAAPATLSVVNPIHAAGTLVVGYADETQQNALFRRSLILAGLLALVVPGVAAILPAVLL